MAKKKTLAALAVIALAGVLPACSSTPSATRQQSAKPGRAIAPLSGIEPNTYLNGTLSSKGGPFLTDRFGRIAVLHGVNAVYKHAPYTMTVEPGKPNTLDDAEARRISALGFNVVRLGVLWAGIEPGHGGPNQPSVCTPGSYQDPGMWSDSAAKAYLDQVSKVVDVLGRHHIYSLVDMHQDVWSSLFSGEGAPDWATCTSGNPIVIYPGRWSNNYGNPAVDAAFGHLFNNDVVGGLQQEYQRSWSAVASRLGKSPWVVGYDPINEPLAVATTTTKQRDYTAGLSCLYGGSGGAVEEIGTGKPLPCPAGTPAKGVVQAIQAADPVHLVMPEVDNASDGRHTLFLGILNLPRIVYNFHDYCPQRSGVTGNPTDLQACSDHELLAMVTREQQRVLYRSKQQPAGPAIMMTEFGATSDAKLASYLVDDAQTVGLSWGWWSWRYYDDPTGSAAEGLYDGKGHYNPAVKPLTTTYPSAIAGTPLTAQSSDLNGEFTLAYQPDPKISAPTTIVVSSRDYPIGYCAYVNGGKVTSRPGAHLMTVAANGTGNTVVVRIQPGKCINANATS